MRKIDTPTSDWFLTPTTHTPPRFPSHTRTHTMILPLHAPQRAARPPARRGAAATRRAAPTRRAPPPRAAPDDDDTAAEGERECW